MQPNDNQTPDRQNSNNQKQDLYPNSNELNDSTFNAINPATQQEQSHNTGLYSTNPETISKDLQLGHTTSDQYISGGINNSAAPQNTKHNSSLIKNKKFWIILLLFMSLISIVIVTYIFLIYIPNKPENIWKTGLNRTGQQLDAAIKKLSDKETLQKIQKNQITANGALTLEGSTLNIDLNSVYDSENTNTSLSLENDTNQKVNAQNIGLTLKTHLPKQATFPNIYINISGLDQLGIGILQTADSSIDDTWVAIEQDTWRNLLNNNPNVENSNLTQDEAISIIKDSQEVINEYIFTDDINNSVIILDKFLATEDSEGIKANHYLFRINKNNAKLFCEAYVEKLGSNKAVKRLTGLNDADYGALAIKTKESCPDVVKAVDETKVYDIWIDKKYKIIHKVRIYTDLESSAEELSNKNKECLLSVANFDNPQDFCSYIEEQIETGEIYTEFGQVYSGNENLKLFINNMSKTNKQDSRISFETDINIDELNLNGKLKYNNSFNNQNTELSISFETKPYSGEIDSTKPEGAISIQEALKILGQNIDIYDINPL
jgi:hypothetical protein